MNRTRWHRGTLALVALASAIMISSCEREARRYQVTQASTNQPAVVRQTSFAPGSPAQEPEQPNPYLKNAYGLSEGKRLYSAYNCVGCHAHGGGAIGPPLMDDKWIYGSSPRQIYSVIVEGRPNGMPSFAGRIPDQQVWQIVAYVQSMSGQAPKDAAPSRSDELWVVKPESRTERQPPVQTGHR